MDPPSDSNPCAGQENNKRPWADKDGPTAGNTQAHMQRPSSFAHRTQNEPTNTTPRTALQTPDADEPTTIDPRLISLLPQLFEDKTNMYSISGSDRQSNATGMGDDMIEYGEQEWLQQENQLAYQEMREEVVQQGLFATGLPIPPSAVPLLPPITCQTCGEAFKGEIEVQRHMATHVPREARPTYVCDFPGCGRDYLNKANLTLHKLRHH